MTETQTIKCLVQNDLYESPHSDIVLETMEPGTIIEVEREEIEVSGVIMRVARPRGAVQFDLEWFSILPDEEEPALPNNDLDDDFDTLVLDGVVQLAVSSKTCHVEGVRGVCASGGLFDFGRERVARLLRWGVGGGLWGTQARCRSQAGRKLPCLPQRSSAPGR